jgi:hypothetical protein
MKKKEKIQDILGVFQEGIFEELSMNGKDLNFKIECRYLADIINANYSFFYGVFKNVKDFYFVPWDEEALMINDPSEIKSLRPDILTVEISEEEEGYIKIYSNCMNTYSGGIFYINASKVKIYDEDLRELSHEELAELSDKYWYSDNNAEG